MLIDIDKIKVSERIRKDFGNIEELANDIKENGLINPPVVSPDSYLKPKLENLNICKICGVPFVDKHHIVPKEIGGNDMEDNLIYLCSNHHRMLHFLFDLENKMESDSFNKINKIKFEKIFNQYKYILSYESNILQFYRDVMLPKVINHLSLEIEKVEQNIKNK